MREHEVPIHVQAEDKVLLWFTFPQIVAVVAVCALAYGRLICICRLMLLSVTGQSSDGEDVAPP
jgi:hypothetical protein